MGISLRPTQGILDEEPRPGAKLESDWDDLAPRVMTSDCRDLGTRRQGAVSEPVETVRERAQSV